MMTNKIVALAVGLFVMATAACGSEEPPEIDYETVGTYEDSPPPRLEIDPEPTPSPVVTPREPTEYEYEYTDSEYEDLESEYEDLEGEYEDLEDEYDDLEDEYEED